VVNPKEQFTLADLVSIERDNRVLVRMDMYIDHSSKLFVTKHGVIPPGASVEALLSWLTRWPRHCTAAHSLNPA